MRTNECRYPLHCIFQEIAALLLLWFVLHTIFHRVARGNPYQTILRTRWNPGAESIRPGIGWMSGPQDRPEKSYAAWVQNGRTVKFVGGVATWQEGRGRAE